MGTFPVVLRGAVQITPSTVRFSVVADGPDGPGTVTAGFREVDTCGGGFELVEEAVEHGISAIRESGAEVIDLFAAPELKGSRLAAILAGRARRLGIGKVRFTGSGAAVAASFISRTWDLPTGLGADRSGDSEVSACGVIGIGHHSAGLAVGVPGEAPKWIGSRPAGVARVAERSRVSDPPEPAQLAAARSAVERALGSFSSPSFASLVSVSDFSAATRTLIGRDSVDADLLGDLLDSLSGMTADEVSARTGLGPVLAPLFPIAVVVQQAAARIFDIAVAPRDPDPAGLGLALAELSDAGV